VLIISLLAMTDVVLPSATSLLTLSELPLFFYRYVFPLNV
jgi:hypothetical protein